MMLNTSAILFLLATCVLRAQDSSEWQPRLDRLSADYRAAVERRITLTATGLRLGLPYPVATETMTEAEVRAEAQRRTAALVNKQIPKADREVLEAAATARYTPWERGQRVEFIDRRGRTHSGLLTMVSPTRIQVGGVMVSAADFTDDIRVRVDPVFCGKVRKDEVPRSLKQNEMARERAYKDAFPACLADVYREAGFTLHEGVFLASASVLPPKCVDI
jgi:hypothetical protein